MSISIGTQGISINRLVASLNNAERKTMGKKNHKNCIDLNDPRNKNLQILDTNGKTSNGWILGPKETKTAYDMNKDGKVTRADFEMLDTDQDGYITKKELEGRKQYMKAKEKAKKEKKSAAAPPAPVAEPKPGGKLSLVG